MLTALTSNKSRRRRGTTTVEFAIVCPLVFTFFFAAVEFARSNQIMNATSNAAYQGCRASIVPGATASGVVAETKKYLDAGLISGATITVNPSTITNSTSTVTVTVAVPLSSNMWIGPSFTGGKTVTRSCTLTREKTN